MSLYVKVLLPARYPLVSGSPDKGYEGPFGAIAAKAQCCFSPYSFASDSDFWFLILFFLSVFPFRMLRGLTTYSDWLCKKAKRGAVLLHPPLIILVRLHNTNFFLLIEYFCCCCFFRFIFSDVDLNPIMHSLVWCVVLTFLLLLLTTQEGNGKLSIFCSQNLNSFST